jgi:hypothetical protein
LAIILSGIPHITQFALYYAYGPIENIFLVLLAIVLAAFITIYSAFGNNINNNNPILAITILIVSITIVGLFGIPGLITTTILGKVIFQVFMRSAIKTSGNTQTTERIEH